MNFVKCNLCGKDDCEVYIRSLCVGDQDKSRKFATTSNYVGSENIVKCKNCGLIYVNPQIEQKEIIEGYTNADEKYYVKEEKARSNTFKACLKQVENYSKKGKMLDVGCAAGFFLKLAKDSGWEVCGVEPNKWLVNWGKKKFGIDIRNGSF
ncbi:class I SAM-dependent methyltransferase, partial [Patescibacteria group bacterium]|nr:class I SAM-dependent methyltransferase [Patescibacteria group bacterium]